MRFLLSDIWSESWYRVGMVTWRQQAHKDKTTAAAFQEAGQRRRRNENQPSLWRQAPDTSAYTPLARTESRDHI